ncbi:hypothetical protein [uncultured Anaerococcus sp.]|uniref:hypothetical protein n=1 Tax=uncultured Anaerococcus sp. TaxID=293428 RepID=UPI00262E2BF5|nr:hypothetical protein [uncultured Anaerococcus sp.]
MKKKKIYLGAFALALSLGTIVPLKDCTINSYAYAAEDSAVNEKYKELEILINEKETIQKSASYLNASKDEKEAYDQAIDRAKAAVDSNENSNIDQLVKNIESAKNNLGENSALTYENRQALASTIEMAKKLNSSLENKLLAVEDKTDLANTINESIATLNDNKSTSSSIEEQNKKLYELISNLESKYELDGVSALSNEDMDKLSASDNNNYGKARKDLGSLIETVDEFTKSNDYPKISNQVIASDLSQLSKEAKEAYKNPQSSVDELISKYKKLNEVYNKALSNIDSENTEISRLKKQIETYAKEPENYNKANVSAKKTYDSAKTKALEIIAKDNPSIDELDRALNNLKLATLNLSPVRTKTLETKNKASSEAEIEELRKLVNDSSNERNKAAYKNAAEDKKKAYDDAITEAKTLLSNSDNNINNKEVELFIENIKNALSELNTNSKNAESKTQLNDLISKAELAMNNKDYPKVAQQYRDSLKKAYDKAKLANTDEEIKSAISDLESALKADPINKLLKDRNKKDLNNYSLEELIALANKVKNHDDYKKDVSSTQANNLISAIKAGEFAIETGKEDDKATAKEGLINALKQNEIKAIVKKILENDNVKKEESEDSDDSKTLTYKQIIEKIIGEDESFRSTEKYKRAQKSLRDNYDKALAEAKEVLSKQDAKDDNLKKTSDTLVAAKDELDGDKYTTKLKEISDKFAKDGSSITDSKTKEDIDKKIKALTDSKDATMDDILALETELNNAIPKSNVTGQVSSDNQVSTSTVPTTTTTPVTTTKQVPATINPGSIVRTGIKSLAGVIVVLAVAIGAFAYTSKNNKKDDNEKKNRR